MSSFFLLLKPICRGVYIDNELNAMRLAKIPHKTTVPLQDIPVYMIIHLFTFLTCAYTGLATDVMEKVKNIVGRLKYQSKLKEYTSTHMLQVAMTSTQESHREKHYGSHLF